MDACAQLASSFVLGPVPRETELPTEMAPPTGTAPPTGIAQPTEMAPHTGIVLAAYMQCEFSNFI